MKFSANLGFLWTDRSLTQAIHAAAAAGFSAVECHWPYDTPCTAVKAALGATSLHMIGLNTLRGDSAAGENGLAALPGRVREARVNIDKALSYAEAVGAQAVHVMAGNASGPEAERTFVENLRYACVRAGDRTVLIEPLNRHDAPGYFLQTTDQASSLIEFVGEQNLKLMFDCYHVGRTEGDITTRLRDLMPIIGHIQFASVPDRGPPNSGELNYRMIFRSISELGWTQPLGAEYKPVGQTGESLGWMSEF